MQIIKEKHEWVIVPGKRAKEAPKYHLEAVLGISKLEVANGWLFPNDEFDFRNEIHHELTIRSHRILKPAAPASELRIALTQDAENKATECLTQSGIG
ncbi:MAG TPA: hypothetical protein VK638_04810, partial [Edaphobacter sp.]|nr:hypothetical protein [Edaphobacter sp.]